MIHAFEQTARQLAPALSFLRPGSISSPDKPMLKPLTSLADKIAGISTYNPQIVFELILNFHTKIGIVS